MKIYTENTLMGWPKKELVDYIRCCIVNLDSVEQTLEQHIKNVKDWEPPIKKGRWLMHSDFPDRLICSECGAQFDTWHWESEQMHFCPNCGADMRGGENDG